MQYRKARPISVQTFGAGFREQGFCLPDASGWGSLDTNPSKQAAKGAGECETELHCWGTCVSYDMYVPNDANPLPQLGVMRVQILAHLGADGGVAVGREAGHQGVVE